MTIDAIRLDDETTWPRDLHTLLNAHLATLQAYEVARKRIDRQSKDDVLLRVRSRLNPHEQSREQLLADLNEQLASQSFIGFHCTRLHYDEITAILEHGLHPLSSQLVAARIGRRQEAGDISPQVAERLLQENQVSDTNRQGLLWFIFTQPLLQDGWGVGRLFRSWGGEALYNSHEDDPETGPVLCRIGVPCIIEAAIPVKEINTFCTVGERLLCVFLARRGSTTGHDPNMEGYVRSTIAAERIQRVIQATDPTFAQLTGSLQWD